ncbi:hypothetical protein [Vreelandella alkaliphila]|uniref:Uncharacterized protein n=1 Tax=Vreelandella alkaliphila TaxID=272774 RepID=A0AAJ2RXK1_9GAMM|nr:hypothetical protein [Halomonas alkaliphila]MDX5979596.1 hypothetical protein [Halomonas alkaliphila]
MPKPIIVTHPVTGKEVSLKQLAESAGLVPVTVTRRYNKGKRGADLIAPMSQRSKTLKKNNEVRKAKRQKGTRLASYSQRLASAPSLGDLGRLKEQMA